MDISGELQEIGGCGAYRKAGEWSDKQGYKNRRAYSTDTQEYETVKSNSYEGWERISCIKILNLYYLKTA